MAPPGFGLEYIGEDEVTVVAGRFNAHHFQYVDTAGELPAEHPPCELCCSADDDCLFPKGQVYGDLQTHYELNDR